MQRYYSYSCKNEPALHKFDTGLVPNFRSVDVSINLSEAVERTKDARLLC